MKRIASARRRLRRQRPPFIFTPKFDITMVEIMKDLDPYFSSPVPDAGINLRGQR